MVAHDPAPHTAENDHSAGRRLYGAGDRGAAQRDVDDPAIMNVAVRQDQLRGANAKFDPLVLPLLAKPQALLVDESGQKIGNALSLIEARQDAHGKASPRRRA